MREIVIKLDNDLLKGIINGKKDEPRDIVRSFQATIADAIKHGTLLPKKHGNLVDVDELLKQAHIEEDEEGDIFVKKWYCIEKNAFDNASAIVKAHRKKG